MQLAHGAGSLRGKLIAASCALLGTSQLARAQAHDVVDTINRALADWELDGAVAYYHENGRIQAVEPVINASHELADGGNSVSISRSTRCRAVAPTEPSRAPSRRHSPHRRPKVWLRRGIFTQSEPDISL